MDMRAKKTNRSIKNAFLQLRARKPVERITVKELSELAGISKATFYLHYQDIFDLSEQMEYEVIQNIIADVVGSGIDVFDTLEFSRKMHVSFSAHQVLINTLFSGGQSAVLPLKIEQGVKEEILRKHRIIGQKRAADIRQRKNVSFYLIVSVLWHDNQAVKPRLPAR